MIYLGIFPLIFFVIFLISYLKDARKLVNGFLFNLFFVAFLIFCLAISVSSDNQFVRLIILIPAIAIILMLPFAFLALMFGLFLNARILWQREGKRFANSLTLLVAIIMLLFMLLPIVYPESLRSEHLQPIFVAISLITFYFFINLSNFLTAYFLYQFNRPKYNQDFIIVLGSGLINDKVPPLLASRIQKAIQFYRKQATITTPPTIIFSGGQGADENLPEAEAMQKYAIEQGILLEHTLQENRSVNTYQNMLFSKQLMDQLTQGKSYNSIFTTNNFHLFRAGLYARQAGLNSQGIGSKTAFYYWPNAMIREYVAIVVLQRKRHIKIIAPILLLAITFAILSFILV
ncbi:YdcF family protein [Lysinibacillus piscis]|uniref:Membrane protein n=1 Tax=Lysinibacillus piscis TaxID=2518931 RepID=A0ABQ5NNS8_9BACI|nr:YdcF family protein [Lysinibacillus sp. KH24]GLC90010.1 membrane protein [Lysinibacillus sp. KH24]